MLNLYTDLNKLTIAGYHSIGYDNNFSSLKKIKFIPCPKEFLYEAYEKVQNHRDSISTNPDIKHKTDVIKRIEKLKGTIRLMEMCKIGLVSIHSTLDNDKAEKIFRDTLKKLKYDIPDREKLIKRVISGIKQYEIELKEYIKELDEPLNNSMIRASLKGWDLLMDNLVQLEISGVKMDLDTNMVRYCMAINNCTEKKQSHGGK